MASVRVRLSGSTIHWPGYCACCLLALDGRSAKPGRDGLAVPWCEDCQRHVSMHKVERFALNGRWVSLGLFALLLAAGLLLLRGMSKIFTLGASATFLLFAGFLAAVRRLRLEDRKDSCQSWAFPVRVVARDAAGVLVECDNADFAVLLVEANPGATMGAP